MKVGEKPPRESWDVRVRAALAATSWDVYVCANADDREDSYLGYAWWGKSMPRPWIEIHRYDDEGVPTLRFVPMLMEASGEAKAQRAWEAFAGARQVAAVLNDQRIPY